MRFLSVAFIILLLIVIINLVNKKSRDKNIIIKYILSVK